MMRAAPPIARYRKKKPTIPICLPAAGNTLPLGSPSFPARAEHVARHRTQGGDETRGEQSLSFSE
jgi:hypothetical protein